MSKPKIQIKMKVDSRPYIEGERILNYFAMHVAADWRKDLMMDFCYDDFIDTGLKKINDWYNTRIREFGINSHLLVEFDKFKEIMSESIPEFKDFPWENIIPEGVMVRI